MASDLAPLSEYLGQTGRLEYVNSWSGGLHVCSAKTQLSLCIRTVWRSKASSGGVVSRRTCNLVGNAMARLILQAGWMCNLIRAFAVCMYPENPFFSGHSSNIYFLHSFYKWHRIAIFWWICQYADTCINIRHVHLYVCLQMKFIHRKIKLSRDTVVAKRLHVPLAKTQMRLSIRAVWWESSKGTLWVDKNQKRLQGMCRQQRPRSACASAQSDQGLRCPLTEILDITEWMKGEQMPRWYFSHEQVDLNVQFAHVWRHVFAWHGQIKTLFISKQNIYSQKRKINKILSIIIKRLVVKSKQMLFMIRLSKYLKAKMYLYVS